MPLIIHAKTVINNNATATDGNLQDEFTQERVYDKNTQPGLTQSVINARELNASREEKQKVIDFQESRDGRRYQTRRDTRQKADKKAEAEAKEAKQTAIDADKKKVKSHALKYAKEMKNRAAIQREAKTTMKDDIKRVETELKSPADMARKFANRAAAAGRPMDKITYRAPTAKVAAQEADDEFDEYLDMARRRASRRKRKR